MPHGLWQPRTSSTGKPQPWRCRITMSDGTRRVVSTRQKDLGAAREAYKRLQRAAARGEELWGPRPAKLRPVLDSFIASRACNGGHRGTGCAPDTIEFYRHKADRLVEVFGGDRDCNRLRLEDLECYIGTRREAGIADYTIGKELGTLRAALRRARRTSGLRLDVATIWPEFRPDYRPGERWLRPEELAKLLPELPERRREVVELLVYTGARDAEWRRLTARHINWSDKLLELPGTKTGAAQRAIPFAEHPALEALLRSRSQARIGGRLFSSWSNIRRDLHAAAERARIAPLSPNDLRRTFATWLRLAGVEVDRIAKLLGHANSRLAERVYGKLPAVALAGDVARGFAWGVRAPASPRPQLAPPEAMRAVLALLEQVHAYAAVA